MNITKVTRVTTTDITESPKSLVILYDTGVQFSFFETDEDSASCLIAVILGGLIGYFYMPIIAFSFEQKTSYWIASICMILSSFIFN